MSQENCKCGHTLKQHYADLLWCETCFYTYPNSTRWQHRYELDNLSFVEKLAEMKNLI